MLLYVLLVSVLIWSIVASFPGPRQSIEPPVVVVVQRPPESGCLPLLFILTLLAGLFVVLFAVPA